MWTCISALANSGTYFELSLCLKTIPRPLHIAISLQRKKNNLRLHPSKVDKSGIRTHAGISPMRIPCRGTSFRLSHTPWTARPSCQQPFTLISLYGPLLSEPFQCQRFPSTANASVLTCLVLFSTVGSSNPSTRLRFIKSLCILLLKIYGLSLALS